MNLQPHLSKKIVGLDYDDVLLNNDWDIYLLDLGTTVELDGFVNVLVYKKTTMLL